MDAEAVEEAKAGLRVRAHEQRAAFAQSLRAEAAEAATRHFFEHVMLAPTDIVAAYWPIRDELDCRGVLTRLMDAGQPVCLPIVKGDEEPLEMHLWEVGAPLYPSGFGILAPIETSPLVEPDVIMVPLLGFDGLGTRLGYGRGYYDRTLALMTKKPKLIGFAFAAQELPEIPREAHDVPLDGLITENGYRDFAPSGAPP